ncbi:MAG: transporter substrate-binding domain-containing protein [Lachnospiraceae bacterium]|nr:transporter substrate-binding domain-containing protein [Lachnospiraceae bacterium]
MNIDRIRHNLLCACDKQAEKIAEDLAADLDVSLEYVETSWPTLMDDVLAGKFDLAISGITINDVRKEKALMSDGYLENGKTILCRKEDASKYIGTDDASADAA